MAEASGLRLRRPPEAEAAAVERALRQVPCPFVGPLRFAIWQVSSGKTPTGADPRQASPEETDADPRQAVAEPVRPDLAVAVEFPHLTGTAPAGLLAALTELVAAFGTATDGGPFSDRAGWWVSAAGTEWFATVHADSYPGGHARHWPRPGAVVVLVPRLAFDHGFPDGVPDATRQAIRTAFARRGVRYPVGGAAIADG